MKPNWRKVIITVLLILISFIIGLRTEAGEPEVGTIGLPYTKVYFNPILWLPYGLGSNCPGSEQFCHIEWTTNITAFNIIYKTPALLLTTLIYWYLLSCVIIWIYYKVKKK